jgi:SanA protein
MPLLKDLWARLRSAALPGKRPSGSTKQKTGGMLVKLLKASSYAVIVIAFLLIYYAKEFSEVIRKFGENENGALITIYRAIAAYFVDAEAWNFIFIIAFLSASMVVFASIDALVQWGFGKVSKKWGWAGFCSTGLFRFLVQKVISVGILFMLFTMSSNAVIIWYGNNNSYNDVGQVPYKMPVLLLGTSKWLSSGKGENLYYLYRVDAAARLYHANKTDRVIISGDKTVHGKGNVYDETYDMRTDLIALGVPDSVIETDTAGYRTLDSVLRFREIYGLKEILVVSQQFHVQRALFLSMFYGIRAKGYNADGSATSQMVKRETFSKPKVILDLLFFNMQPRQKIEGAKYVYREKFEIDTDIDIILIITLTLSFIFAFMALLKGME